MMQARPLIRPPIRPQVVSHRERWTRAFVVVSRSLVPTLMWVVVAGSGCSSSAGSNSTGDADSGANDPSLEPVLDASRPLAPPGRDGAAACPAGICNYQTGAGCAADTPSCVPLPNAQGTAVLPACAPAGALVSGEACHEWSDCAPGNVCVGGVCRKLCCAGDSSACAGGEHCVRRFELDLGQAGVVASGADLCFPVNTCNVLLDGCDPLERRTACQIADVTGATACLPTGARGAGDRCDEHTACVAGFTCADQWCRRFCAAVSGGAEPRCPPQEGRCVHFQNDPAGVGECTPI